MFRPVPQPASKIVIPLRDVAAQELIEDVDVDGAELFLEAHEPILSQRPRIYLRREFMRSPAFIMEPWDGKVVGGG